MSCPEHTAKYCRTITFTPEKLVALRKARDRAIEVNCETFVFEGQGLRVDYAGYLIEFLEERDL